MLVIACPHALGLAIPLVVSLSTAVSARAGILVKDRLALERMRSIDTVLFDKTGTLTKGAHVVSGVAAAGGLDESDVLRLAAAVESDSEHPLARAIVAAARARGEIPPADGFRAFTGRGVEATVDGVRYAVGGPALLRERHLDAARRAGRLDRRLGAAGRGRAVPHPQRRVRATSSANEVAVRSRSRTRCGPRPGRPSTTSAGWAWRWR